jgi:pyruvate-formate lyase-activating enzyme
MTKNITVQAIATKPTKTGGTKYGIKDQDDVWYSTFQNPKVEKGGEYRIEYETGQYGNDLKEINPLSERENQTKDKNTNNSIVRQHSQEMSLRFLIAQGKSFSLDDVKEMTDWFQEDVENTEVPF